MTKLAETNLLGSGAPVAGEIYSVERLEEHARELARSHGEASLAVTARPLLDRFQEAKRAIGGAYEELTRRERAAADPTPAEEWLLDNSHVIDDQVREIEEDLPRGYLLELPRLAGAGHDGYPRVYALAIDFISHTDARIDAETLVRYVNAYQAAHTLTIGELWAVPIMLRLGLVQSAARLATQEVETAAQRARADVWAERILERARRRSSEVVVEVAKLAVSDEPRDPAFIVQLLRRLRVHDALAASAFHWVHEHCAEIGTSADEMTRLEHLRQAENQVSIGNAITSMRAIAALDWNLIFERTSAVEHALCEDPASAYEETDAPSRDRYRHAVEDLARRSDVSELAIAELVVRRATEAKARTKAQSGGDPRAAHVGYWLVDDGRPTIEREIAYRPKVRERVASAVLAAAAPVYLGAIAIGTAGFVALAIAAPHAMRLGPAALVAVALLVALPTSEVAITVVNWVASALFKPRLLAKLAFEEGIPVEFRTLVVVPSLITSEENVRELLEDLEVRALANPDPQLHFALLTDLADAEVAERPGEAALLAFVRERVAELDARHGGGRIFWFHRRRVHAEKDDKWMGWERKRGKLEELDRLLRGRGDTTFQIVTAEPTLLASVRYVLTLDADTQLPRDVARRLVGAIAHPLNRAQLDPATGRVVRGYGIVQPRVGTTLESASRSRFARIAAGPAGIDPYTTAVSDVYQDLFGEGSYIGKAIYDVDAFDAALAGRIPENRLLSHDLFEGLYARTALATDIELLDDQPSAYAVHAGRQRRWVRGDWQLASWLLPWVPKRGGGHARNDLPAIGRWKLFDNLRRSLLAPSILVVLLVGWLAVPASAARWTAIAALALATPLVGRLATALVRREKHKWSAPALGALFGDLRTNAAVVALSLVFLVDQALLMVDAIVRTLYRLAVSGKNLLEWQTAASAERVFAGARAGLALRRLWLGPALATATAVSLLWFTPALLLLAAPFLVAWAAAPFVAAWVSRPLRARERPLSDASRTQLRRTARKIWCFFETFVTAADNWLPPDNYQEDPKGVVAHRTSPTNIGLYLLSTVAARDFGFLTLSQLEERLSQTLGTIEKLERHEGHVLNWYDTTSLAILAPRYVSTVDSGNLAAHLWTLRQACRELEEAPLVGLNVLDAALDALALAGEDDALRPLISALEAARATPPLDLAAWLTQLRALAVAAEAARPPPAGASSKPFAVKPADWIARAARGLTDAVAELDAFAPWVRLTARPTAATADELDALPRTASAAWLASLLAKASGEWERGDGTATALADAAARANDLLARLRSAGERGAKLADEMSFGLVYSPARELFAIGYNVDAARLDASHYDLLASEARLASLLAIAKGDLPQKHWFRLGRQLTKAADRRALLSWSGSMFEYLMPLLVTRTYERTLLDETYVAVVRRQREYGAQRGVAWGVSESAFNTMDLGLTYQYRAFGVPGLGLKPGLAEDLVIAPYATLLATMVNPDLAAKNLRALEKEGGSGAFGFYESIDYTPERVPPGRHGVVVKAFMAHHQGMSLVALDNVLNGDPMQRRFHAEPRIKASELLLQERIPPVAVLAEPRAVDVAAAPAPLDEGPDAIQHVTSPTAGPPRAHLLAYGDFSIVVTATGTGQLVWKGLDITRWREDAALDAWGSFCYLRDVASGALWSAGHQPTRRAAEQYEASFAADHVSLHRNDGDIETLTEIVVSPEYPAEVRRMTLTNHGAGARTIELTTYAELVLAPRGADLAHPVFNSMFVQTEIVADRAALLATRRPRSPDDPTPWAVHVLSVEEGDIGAPEFETSRAAFVGRGRTLAWPAALEPGARLGGTSGTVLDPIFSLRCKVTLPPGGRARIAFTTALASSRDGALDLADRFHDTRTVARTFELAWTDARVELKHLRVSPAQAQLFQQLASALIFPTPALRAPPSLIARNARGKEGLWAYGISGDNPILLLRLDDAEPEELLKELLGAHEFWRLNGLTVDLVLLNEEPSGYLRPLQEQTLAVIRASPAQGHLDQPGGVFVRRADQIPEEDQILLQAAARVVLLASGGTLARQLRRATAKEMAAAPPFVPSRKQTMASAPSSAPRRDLVFWNGLGGFRPDGREYVIILGPGARTPAPWCNVIANPRFGFVISEAGAGFTWRDNSQSHRLTPWSNDPVIDPSGEAIYLRDEDDGAIWSPSPLEWSLFPYVVRHGQGYSAFEHTRSGVRSELTVFVDPEDPVKVWRLVLENRDTRPRRLSVYGYVEWVLGTNRDGNAPHVVTERDAATSSVLARSAFSAFAGRVAFFGASAEVRAGTGDRTEFLGRSGSRRRPAALARATLGGRFGAALDPCAALQLEVRLAPGETREIAFILGEGDDRNGALALLAKYREPARAATTLAAAIARWDKLLGAVVVETPDPAFDLMQNRWLLYQAIACRLWARSAFYQSGGAYGFRDQLQDSLAVVHTAPEIARAQILRSAARQFIEGDVQHWWHPESGQGVRTRYSDDLLWLPYVTARYVDATGDRSVLDEVVPFIESRPLDDKAHEVFGVPTVSSQSASIYEHCTRALDRGTTQGAHGLPLMGGGDWNDGMNRVGEKGQGESVWVAWFLAATLKAFAPIAEARSDAARVATGAAELTRLTTAVEEAWDGAWYRRAYFDDGTPLGSHDNEACAIDAIAQSWAVIAAIGDPARARQAMQSTYERLVKPEDAMILLFTPPFDHGAQDPGYIKAYPPGLRENGGQYTHGVLWSVLAIALLGDGNRASELFGLLNPIHHATTPDRVARYKVEPYVVAADLYAASVHVGRGGWTWYTGSASWMFRIGLEAILGLERRGDSLTFTPCIPAAWPRYAITYRFGTSHYRITVENPDHVTSGVVRVEVDGAVAAAKSVALRDDGRTHEVHVVLGELGGKV